MDKDNLAEKMNNCKLRGTSECPNVDKMNYLFSPERPQSKPTSFLNPKDLNEDAEFCRNCDKYEVD